MLVDSHCHLPLMDADDFNGDIANAVDLAGAQGVDYLLCVSVDLESYPQVLETAKRFANVSASVGLHPNHETEHEPDVDQLVALATDEHVVAVGETGLDYFRSEGNLDWQRDRFRRHIEAAKQVRKPLIIHSRDASPDTTTILAEEHAEQVGGVMHCFVDDWDTATRALDLGFYISLSGIVTFKNAAQVQDVARQVPLDRLLVETDSPYLAPVPNRGKANQPAYVRHVAEFIATLRGESFETIARQTTENYFRLFSHARH